ncbi:hypothetical protein H6P81_004495 [Aristolochia fimbriata]|uniref:Uncharacterized protein n=1 Tax=Aristolochia fimbriata TaxID=158543 RepID=A0AAV7FHR5_ARIFI|nr:hypothetical protein H6P81_004495 [Aristolochia fimbriata]
MVQTLLLPHRHFVLIPTKFRRIPRRRREVTFTLASLRESSSLGPLSTSSASYSQSAVLEQSTSVPRPMTHLAKKLGFRPTPELGLLSLAFVITAVFGAFVSVAVISLPAMLAFRELAASMQKLTKVVEEEVPGTLSSLKLSSLEINDLTQQLSSLRQKISGKQNGTTKERKAKRRWNGEGRNPIIN